MSNTSQSRPPVAPKSPADKVKHGAVFRVTGLPGGKPLKGVKSELQKTIEAQEQGLSVKIEVVPSCYDDTLVALVEFPNGTPDFLSELTRDPLSSWGMEMGMDDISFDRHFFGFTQLYPTAEGRPVAADIIAITGLDGNAYGSWRGRDNLGRMWLRHWLSSSMPDCRTMTYGYNSKLSVRGIDTLEDYSRELLEGIKNLQERPLIFVAHSFGGIILAHALIQAKLVGTEEGVGRTTTSLVTATRGILFFGVPHSGLFVEDVVSMVGEGHPRKQLVEKLSKSSDALRSQLRDFRNIARNFKIDGKSWKRSGEYITFVESDSALLLLPDDMEAKVKVSENHSNIVKFRGRQQEPYITTLRYLRELTSPKDKTGVTTGGIATNITAPRVFSRYNARQREISSAYAGTCDWLRGTKQYKRWWNRRDVSNHNGVLWIKGKPGAGKSTLLRHTLKHVQDSADVGDTTIAAYFFHARGDNLEKSPQGMLRSLVSQLLEAEPQLQEKLVYLFREKAALGFVQWGDVELKQFFLDNIRGSKARRVFLFVDALDECREGDVRDVVNFLADLSEQGVHDEVNLNICLSSRHYPHTQMKKMIEVDVGKEQAHNEDLTRYVNGKLPDIEDPSIKELIVEKASGVFMWVVLVVARVKQAHEKGDSNRNLHEILHKIPGDMDDLYQTILDQDTSKRAETVRVFQWVLFAEHALSPEELYWVVWENDQNGGKTPSLDVLERRIREVSKGLVEITGENNFDRKVQFIHESVVDFLLRNRRLQRLSTTLENNMVGVSHCQLRDICMRYLLKPREGLSPGLEVLEWGHPPAGYASHFVFWHADRAQAAGLSQYNFIRGDPRRWDWLLSNLLYSTMPMPRDVSLLYAMTSLGHKNLTEMLLETATVAEVNVSGGSYGNPLQAVAVQGWDDIVVKLLKSGADVNTQAGVFHTALQAAVAVMDVNSPPDKTDQQYGIINTLLGHKADVNAIGGIYGTALHAALARGNQIVARLLMDNGADITATGGWYGTTFHAAMASKIFGEEDIMRRLIRGGADPNTCGSCDELKVATSPYAFEKDEVRVSAEGGQPLWAPPLFRAVELNSVAMVNLFLELGADINGTCGIPPNDLPSLCSFEIYSMGSTRHIRMGSTSLMMACALLAGGSEGKTTLVELLLDRGADVAAQSEDGATALLWAVRQDDYRIAKLLLNNGADPHATTSSGETILHAAAVHGNCDTIKLFLKQNVDIDARDEYGRTALYLASRYRRAKAVQLLLQMRPNQKLDHVAGLLFKMVPPQGRHVKRLEVNSGCFYISQTPGLQITIDELIVRDGNLYIEDSGNGVRVGNIAVEAGILHVEDTKGFGPAFLKRVNISGGAFRTVGLLVIGEMTVSGDGSFLPNGQMTIDSLTTEEINSVQVAGGLSVLALRRWESLSISPTRKPEGDAESKGVAKAEMMPGLSLTLGNGETAQYSDDSQTNDLKETGIVMDINHATGKVSIFSTDGVLTACGVAETMAKLPDERFLELTKLQHRWVIELESKALVWRGEYKAIARMLQKAAKRQRSGDWKKKENTGKSHEEGSKTVGIELCSGWEEEVQSPDERKMTATRQLGNSARSGSLVAETPQ
ncbi:hypothetical protein OQA88_4627 [Cercophora sp. LCS_1]